MSPSSNPGNLSMSQPHMISYFEPLPTKPPHISTKKKCDETHPKCLRCTRAGLECGGYAPLDSPDSKGVMRRSKIGTTLSTSTRGSQASPLDRSANASNSCQVVHSGLALALTNEPVVPVTRHPPCSDHGYTGPLTTAQLGNSVAPGFGYPGRFDLTNLPDVGSVATSQPSATIQTSDHLTLASPTNSMPFGTIRPAGPLADVVSSLDYSNPVPYSCSANDPPSFCLLPGQTSSLRSLPGDPDTAAITTFGLVRPTDTLPHIPFGPARPPPNQSANLCDEEHPLTREETLAATRRTMYKAPTPDPNTQDNTLAFVIQAYTRWVNFIVFNPGASRLAPLMEDVVSQFSGSQGLRTRIILIANINGSISKAPVLNSRVMGLVAMLRTQVDQVLACFRPTGQRDLDIRKATEALKHTADMTVINYYVSSFSTMFRLLQGAAPIFRRACPESSEQFINLPNALLRSSIQLGHFAATDVIFSVLSARPMLFKYDVNYTPEMADRITEGTSGLRWLHGFPDQVVVLFARINRLYEDFGIDVDPQQVLDIEEQVRRVKTEVAAEPEDSFAMVWKLTVQECWRQTVYIYLYMRLCQAKADDPRVLRATRTFTRLLNGVMPGRTPDSFMTLPMMIAGISAYKAWDRSLIYRRLSSLRESNTPGSWVNEYLSVLSDIWTRTKAESRPAVWHDVRLAFLKVTGV